MGRGRRRTLGGAPAGRGHGTADNGLPRSEPPGRDRGAPRRSGRVRGAERSCRAVRRDGNADRCNGTQFPLSARARYRTAGRRDCKPGAQRELRNRTALCKRIRPCRSLHTGRSPRRGAWPVSTRSKRMFTWTSRLVRIRAAARSWPTPTTATTSSPNHCGCSIDWAMCSRARGRGCATESGSAEPTDAVTHASSSQMHLTRSSSCAPLRGLTGRDASSGRAASTADVRTTAARDELTPQERQIATLAAEGRTNREIGALLFLSSRTIETHLGRVFKKLGITDRRALATKGSPDG